MPLQWSAAPGFQSGEEGRNVPLEVFSDKEQECYGVRVGMIGGNTQRGLLKSIQLVSVRFADIASWRVGGGIGNQMFHARGPAKPVGDLLETGMLLGKGWNDWREYTARIVKINSAS
jgi:hypothetical protein